MHVSREARIAGWCYLVVIAGGVFAQVFVRERLFVSGDPAATAEAIAAHEALWRRGLAVHLVYLLPGTAAGVILYRIFRPVQGTLALLALVFMAAAIAVEAALLTGLYVPLTMAREAAALGALEEVHRNALAYLAVRLFLVGWNSALLLFAGFCVLVGTLILRSRLIPRVIGALMIAAGAGYVLNTVAGILSPPFARALVPWVLLPAFVGELSLAVWLAAKGVAAKGVAGASADPGEPPAGPGQERLEG